MQVSFRWVDFREIKSRIRMEDTLLMYGVQLKASSAGVVRGQCPLPTHDSASVNSFSVDTRRNIWACHSLSCVAARGGSIGGNVLDFVALMEPCSLREAALLLQDRLLLSSAETARRKLQADLPKANPVLPFALSNVQSHHRYLATRGVDACTAAYFGIGYYAGPGLLSQRIVIPIHDEAGGLVAYAGRSVGDQT
jgi:DNA primase